jgi:hypothetical protein
MPDDRASWQASWKPNNLMGPGMASKHAVQMPTIIQCSDDDGEGTNYCITIHCSNHYGTYIL